MKSTQPDVQRDSFDDHEEDHLRFPTSSTNVSSAAASRATVENQHDGCSESSGASDESKHNREATGLDGIDRGNRSPRTETATGENSSSAVSSTLLREKQQKAYLRIVDRKQQATDKIALPFTLCDRSHSAVTRTGSGRVVTSSPTPYDDRTPDAPTKEYLWGQLSFPNKSRDTNPSYTSYLDESPPSDYNESSFHKNYLDKECSPSPSHNNPLPEGKKKGGDLRLLPRPYLSYLNSASPPNSDRHLPVRDIEPMPMPPRSTNNVIQQQRPGAYAEALGSNVQRLDHIRFSLVGVERIYESEDFTNVNNDEADIEVHNHNDYEDAIDAYDDDDDDDDGPLSFNETTAAPEVPTNTILLEGNNNNCNGLVEALPVSTSFYSSSRRMMAQPVDQQQEAGRREAQEKNSKRCVSFGVFVIIACLVLTGLSLFGVQVTREEESSTDEEAPAPTQSPTRPMPPMENLELLYDELPEKTKESLYNSDSNQYQAWEWLLNHPNITTYPDWRKKQIFAMAIFYYSFEGPNWPETTTGHDRWMDVNIDECNWVMTNFEIAFFAQENAKILGDAYSLEDHRPCNEQGQLQTLLVHNLFLPTTVEPEMPPEIGLLTSIKVLSIVFNRIGGKLSDHLLPELIQLPGLEYLSFHSNGMGEVIPTEVGGMTGLRHLIIGDNQLTGTFPTEIANMSSLEYLVLWRNDLMGSIPSELGRMTSLTALEIDYNLFTGTIPSELGLITTIQQFWLQNNALSGSVPSQLGLMTNCNTLSLGNNKERSPEKSKNNFDGSLPTELWQLSKLEELFLFNLPDLHGSIPTEVMFNLTALRLEGSPNLGGTIPEAICSLLELQEDQEQEFESKFDCSDILCGCDCQCINNKTNHL